jgi:uncharacterized protein YjbJ (UPF0337 family)
MPWRDRIGRTPHDAKEIDMDKDRIAGAGKELKGQIKEVAGKLTGDAKLRADGKADKFEGKVQNAIGGIKDAAREAASKSDET